MFLSCHGHYWAWYVFVMLWRVKVRLTVFNTTFNNTVFQLYGSGQFYWWGKLEYLEKTTDQPAASHLPGTNFYHIMLYRVHLAWARFELTTLVVIGTECIGSCKSSYHMITTTTAPETYRVSQTAKNDVN